MRLEILPLDFLGQGALLEPADPKLHDLVVKYCADNLVNGNSVNLAKFSKCWAVVLMEGTQYKEIVGFSGFVWRPDVPIFRVTGENAVRATKMLIDRMRGFFQDNGARGHEAFLHISSKEKPEQRCDKWEESLASVGAIPAERFSVKI